jgi:L-threonylcarbamoyladenylate synthase
MAAPVLAPDDDALDRAADLLRAGKLVALPTETVYGLAADAGNAEAVARLYAAKGRPAFNPLIAHVLDIDAARAVAAFTPLAETLADAFWPGPLTLVLDRKPGGAVCDLVTAGLDTVAVRAPAHPVARAVLERVGRPLAAPSANTSERLSPTRAADVARDLGGRIDLILDGGPCVHGLESTVVDARGEMPVILRPGALSRDAIEAAAGPVADAATESQTPRAPGALARHYAPRRARVRLEADAAARDEAYLGFGPTLWATLNLSERGDLSEAAARLFPFLRALDDAGYAGIAVAPIPAEGLGEAIRDRLARAAN